MGQRIVLKTRLQQLCHLIHRSLLRLSSQTHLLLIKSKFLYLNLLLREALIQSFILWLIVSLQAGKTWPLLRKSSLTIIIFRWSPEWWTSSQLNYFRLKVLGLELRNCRRSNISWWSQMRATTKNRYWWARKDVGNTENLWLLMEVQWWPEITTRWVLLIKRMVSHSIAHLFRPTGYQKWRLTQWTTLRMVLWTDRLHAQACPPLEPKSFMASKSSTIT